MGLLLAAGAFLALAGCANAQAPAGSSIDVTAATDAAAHWLTAPAVDGARTFAVINPDFDDDVAPWNFVPDEVGRRATAGLDDGALRFDIEASGGGGSVYAVQTVAAASDGPLRFDVSVRDDGRVAGYWFIVREMREDGSTHDHVHGRPPVGSDWTRVAFAFTPQGPNGTTFALHLRVVTLVATPATVWFDDVALTDGAHYAWTVNGATVGAGPQVLATLVPGEHAVSVAVERSGVTDVVTASVDVARTSTPVADVSAPVAAVVGDRVVATAAGSRPATDSEALAGRGFAAGAAHWWPRAEAGGTVRFDDGAVLLGAVSGEATEVAQAAGRFDAPVVTVQASVRADTRPTGATLVIREVQVQHSLADRVILAEASHTVLAGTSWQPVAFDYKPVARDATHVEVALRVVAGPRESRVWWQAPSLSAALAFTWEDRGVALGAGRDVSLPLAAVGIRRPAVTVQDVVGRTDAADAALVVVAKDALHVGPSWHGPNAVAWTLPALPAGTWSVARVAAAGAAEPLPVTVGGTGGAVDDDAPPGVSAYALVVRSEGGNTTVLTVPVTPPAAARDPDLGVSRFKQVGALIPLRLVLPLDTASVQATLTTRPGAVRVVELDQNATEPLVWHGKVSTGSRLSVRPVSLVVTATDWDGTTYALGERVVLLIPVEPGPWQAVFFAALVVVPAAAVGVRRLRSRHDAGLRE